MAVSESNILTEFLVEIGWKTNEDAQKKFVGAIREGAFEANILADTVEKAAGSIAHFAMEMQQHFESLYLQSKQLHTPVDEIHSLQKGFYEVGVSIEAVSTGFNSFFQRIQKFPGSVEQLQKLGIDTSKNYGEQYEQLLTKLHNMKFSGDRDQAALAGRYQEQYGIPEALITQIDEATKHIAAFKKMLKDAQGGDNPAEGAHALGTAWRTLTDTFVEFGRAAADSGWSENVAKGLDGIDKRMKQFAPQWKNFWKDFGHGLYDVFGSLIPGKGGDEARKDVGNTDWTSTFQKLRKGIDNAWYLAFGTTTNEGLKWLIHDWDWNAIGQNIEAGCPEITKALKTYLIEPLKLDIIDLTKSFGKFATWLSDTWTQTIIGAWTKIEDAWTAFKNFFFGGSFGSNEPGGAAGGGTGGATLGNFHKYSGGPGPHAGQRSLLHGGITQGTSDDMAPKGAAPGENVPGGLTTVVSNSGKRFTVAAEFAENFKGFINDYEAAGGVIGPHSGGLGARPNNQSYHPLGRAIDVNQVGYGIRSKDGKTLDPATEQAIADKWGMKTGASFKSRSDIGHFEVNSRANAIAALVKLGIMKAPSPVTPAQGTTKPDLTNNPGDLHFPGNALDYQKLFGGTKSDQTDQGQPLYQFPNLKSGFDAMAALARKKYADGLTTINKLIAAKGGLTPGNTSAAANVAKDMGIDPNADLKGFNDPDLMRKFQAAYGTQEGSYEAVKALKSGQVYGDSALQKLNERLKKQQQQQRENKAKHGAHDIPDRIGQSNVDPHAFGGNIMHGGNTNNNQQQHVTINVHGDSDPHKTAQLVHHELQTAHARATRNLLGNVA